MDSLITQEHLGLALKWRLNCVTHKIKENQKFGYCLFDGNKYCFNTVLTFDMNLNV